MDLSKELLKQKQQVNPWIHGINVVLIFLLVFLISLIKTNYDNQLGNHSFWDPVKMSYRNELSGVNEFLYSRKTLWKSKLHLSEWGGFNEVIWKGGHLQLPLSINLELEDESDFTLIFSKTDKRELGVKIRGKKATLKNGERSFFFSKNSNQEYKILRSVDYKHENKDLKLYLTDSHLVLNQKSFKLPIETEEFEFNKLSLRGGLHPVSIHSLMFGFEDILRYSFDYLNELWGWVTAIGGILSGLYIALLIIFKFRWKRFLIFISSFCLLFGTYEVLDRTLFKGKYPQPEKLKINQVKNHQYKNLLWIRTDLIPKTIQSQVSFILFQGLTKFTKDKDIQKLLQHAKRENKTLILVDHFNYQPSEQDIKNTQMWTDLAEKQNVRFFNPNPILLDNQNKGEIWLNRNHLSTFGYKLLNQQVQTLLSQF
jgi:hypothetical protein